MCDNKLDAILIGLGAVAKYYAAGLGSTNIYNLKYVYDIDDKSISSGAYPGIKRVDTEEYKDILCKRLVKVAIIATPPHTHVKIMRECAKNGIIPIVEKPLTDREDEFRELTAEGLEYRVMLHWKYGFEVLRFLEISKSLNIKSIDVSIRDPYLSEPGSIHPNYISKDGCWIDGGINAISILSQLVDLRWARVKSFETDVDTSCMQPYHASCNMKVGRTKVSIEIDWNSTGKDEKVTVISTDKGKYVLNHSEQSITFPDKSVVTCSQKPRLENHYLNLFSRKPDELTGSSELRMIHKLLYKTMETPKSPLYARALIAFKNLLENIIFAQNAKYKIVFLVLGVVLGFVFLYLSTFDKSQINQALSEIFKQLGTVIFSTVGVLLASIIFKRIEDRTKVTYDDVSIKTLYGDAYRCDFYLNDKPCGLYYECLYERKKGDEIACKVDDKPGQLFTPDEFIRQHTVSILSAHKQSHYSNFDTLRLDDCKVCKSPSNKTSLVFSTSRSTYISHMITNRAVDYMIDGNVSLRQIYEYKSKLSPLAQSKFSNHLALIGMIVLKDDYVLFPHRTTKSTISKNMITSGMAVPFKLDQADVNLSCDETETPFEDFIFDGLASAMKIKRSDLKRDNVNIQLIGVGRDVYEGGKPSFFYQIRIDDMSSDDYLSKTRAYLSNSSKEDLDSNKRIYVVKFKSLVWHKDKSLLTFKAKVRPGKILKHKLCQRPEKNLLANLYHYIKFNECK